MNIGLCVSIILISVVNICLIWRTERLKTAIGILIHNQRILIHKVEGKKDE